MLNRRKYTDTEIKKILGNIIILVDTREKVNEHIIQYFDKHKIVHESLALPYGDYSFAVEAMPELDIPHRIYFYEDDIVIERKNSLEELSGCFAQTRERFKDEWSRCRADRKYLLIENATYEQLVNGEYNTQYNSRSFLASLHSFNANYGMEVVFMPNKSLTPVFILATFQYYLRHIIK